ncbi:TPA: hypothetical protein G8X54_002138 [Salmonella enterica]|uniref:Tetratricopeptide repeat protein n=1 Tax=Salmonella enterica TaxID=28901 RepID=A0A761P1Y0_SALER|nr:hypothetical protein [Salmonella enterica]HAK7993684.1 hypothetical protein [Salmonella enterica]
MIEPQSKTEQCFNDLIDRFFKEDKLSEIEYYRCLKISEKLDTIDDICITGMAKALFGKGDEALDFLDGYLGMCDFQLFKVYGTILIYLKKNKRLLDFTLEYADSFKDDLWYSWIISYYYYMIGDIDNALIKLKRYLQMMTNKEEKSRAEYAMSRHIEQLAKAYAVKASTPEHYRQSMYLALSVLDDFGVTYSYVDVRVFPDQTAACFIEVKSDDPNLVAEMNLCLIKKQIEQGYSIEYDLEPQFTIGRAHGEGFAHGNN